ncbi:hypothetical protein [Streptomyces sp. NBC_01304]|uniref:hypothetical protein n=1 Tax=Streptomyces sp. NBC_01304 TaxID=2903818 RepID=UPI002E0F5DE4|nr:hypothetical protein OG430_48245 [Streptomyces sp. NBC_01304]
MDEEQPPAGDAKQAAIEKAIRLHLSGTKSLFANDEAAAATERALNLGATWGELHAEEIRQRERR